MTDATTLTLHSHSARHTQHLAAAIGAVLHGGEVLEFVSDVGGGKTTFVKGLAEGMGIAETVQSPTFTISRIYAGRDNLELHHFDFYRLGEAGVVAAELAESIGQPNAVVAVEWGEVVHDVLPPERITVTIKNPSGAGGGARDLLFKIPARYRYITETLAGLQPPDPKAEGWAASHQDPRP